MAQSPDKVNAGCSMMSELIIEIYCLNQKRKQIQWGWVGGEKRKAKEKAKKLRMSEIKL